MKRTPGPLRAAFWLALALVASVVVPRAQVSRYDLVIRNGRVVDGTGSPWFRADIGIRGDQIAEVARRIETPSTRTIDAADQVIAPGFIDLHVHAFGGAGQPPPLFPIVEVPTADNYVRQGVTTLITGPDGFSPIPLRTALEIAAKTRISPNLGAFIEHGSVRDAIFGSVDRAPTAGELERMRTLVRAGMHDGAFGLSTGLFYAPAAFSKTDEVIELATVAGAMGGIHKVLALEDAIRKMSSYPAQRIGLTDRGVLREGMRADLVVFDPMAVRDMATFEQPHQYAQGISAVVINGQVAFEGGTMTTARSGRILYGPAHRP